MTGTFIVSAVIVGLMIMAVVSLVRGVVAFLAGSKEELNRAPGDTGPSASQLKQNKMMFARIKYQAMAIILVAIVMVVAKSR